MVILFKILVYMLLIPFQIMLYLTYFMVMIIFYGIMGLISLIRIVWDIISILFKRKIVNKYNVYEEKITKPGTNNKKIIDVTDYEEIDEFERDAKLWNLSEEDKRIAKEERMSPADFIEAEERDDDELITDEWE